MLPRLYVGPGLGLCEGAEMALPDGAARHVQVLRLQPGDPVLLFDGSGGEWSASVGAMGRREVRVTVGTFVAVSRELGADITLALGMPTNERMDTVVEKATELGVSAIQPLICERSVLRLDGERALKKVAHWQGVAIAACEQSGRTRVPVVRPVMGLKAWLAQEAADEANSATKPAVRRGVLSLRDAQWVGDWLQAGTGQQADPTGTSPRSWAFLSGPEGGLSEAEEQLARDQGWAPVSLGSRVLRADTAPLTVMSLMALHHPSPRQG
ncbi:16S rRNA (uracil(1498)-N(3))-methyltransferase [Aquabacterium sp. CECT 9606]|uniref:16S rRNA (uracil(1498)-N(3))-methyltransferase n=1 Tax=Aquabacterium sp. CECT 9606 TaxID=2845822 RepID=UPI001EF9C47C|nr:16S rRNA (uracil(1498)-N(3))-methyltransferase [Aquabacterium sp. CECT 9606]CAH0356242.1 Ribosomal RNA small subunit methyltransferase E [Aquabacterium sp. CECT 9606]